MTSARFAEFISIWRQKFGIERSIDERVCEDEEGRPLPWYTYPATEYLEQFDYHDKRIFEYGCGASSLFWADRAAAVVGIEDNETWFAKWSKEFERPNLEIRLRAEGKAYENAVFEDGSGYDVIAVDGKRRAECAAAAVKALMPGGLIILDDSDRVNTSQDYKQAIAGLKAAGLLQVDFYGFCPMNCYTKCTSLFFHRDFDFKTLFPLQPVCGRGGLWSMSRKERKEFYKKFGMPIKKD